MEALLSSSRLPRRCLLRLRSSHLLSNPKTMVPLRWCWVRCTIRHSTALRARSLVAVAMVVVVVAVTVVVVVAVHHPLRSLAVERRNASRVWAGDMCLLLVPP